MIPTRDRWPLLSRCSLPSALGQEGVSLEVVVVDDASTDGTADRVAALADERVELVRHDAPRGAAAARNAGIARARGEWVAFLDDDDLWAPNRVRAQIDAAGSALWAYGAVVVVDERLRPVDALPVAEPAEVVEALRRGNVVGGGSAVVARTDLLRAVGGFDETLHYLEDWDLWARLADAGAPAVCRERLVATVDHPQRALFRDRAAVSRGIEDFLRRRGAGREARQGAAEWMANEHHRGGRRLQASWLYLRAALAFRSPGNLPPALGALFGERGMRAASRLLSAAGRGSHLDLERRPPPEPPAWLDRYRGA